MNNAFAFGMRRALLLSKTNTIVIPANAGIYEQTGHDSVDPCFRRDDTMGDVCQYRNLLVPAESLSDYSLQLHNTFQEEDSAVEQSIFLIFNF